MSNDLFFVLLTFSNCIKQISHAHQTARLQKFLAKTLSLLLSLLTWKSVAPTTTSQKILSLPLLTLQRW